MSILSRLRVEVLFVAIIISLTSVYAFSCTIDIEQNYEAVVILNAPDEFLEVLVTIQGDPESGSKVNIELSDHVRVVDAIGNQLTEIDPDDFVDGEYTVYVYGVDHASHAENGDGFSVTLVNASDETTDSDSIDITVVAVDSLTPDVGTEVEDGDGDSDTKAFVVETTESGDITVTASPTPSIAEANLPDSWSLTGGTGTGKLSRTVSKATTGTTELKCTAGKTSRTTTVYVVPTSSATFVPSPIITGYTSPAASSSIKRAVGVAVRPEAQAANIQFRVKQGTQDRIKSVNVVSRDTESGTVIIEVFGNSMTPTGAPGGDTTVEGYIGTPPNETVLGEVQVIVVIPRSIATPHPEPDGVVQGSNVCMNSTTSPPRYDVPANKVYRHTIYVHWLSIAVEDQFENRLNWVYAGTDVKEYGNGEWRAINQQMATNGTYSDPVGACVGVLPWVDVDSQDAVDWPTEALKPIIEMTVTQSIPIQVAGHILYVGVVNRTFESTANDTVTITWP